MCICASDDLRERKKKERERPGTSVEPSRPHTPIAPSDRTSTFQRRRASMGQMNNFTGSRPSSASVHRPRPPQPPSDLSSMSSSSFVQRPGEHSQVQDQPSQASSTQDLVPENVKLVFNPFESKEARDSYGPALWQQTPLGFW